MSAAFTNYSQTELEAYPPRLKTRDSRRHRERQRTPICLACLNGKHFGRCLDPLCPCICRSHDWEKTQ